MLEVKVLVPIPLQMCACVLNNEEESQQLFSSISVQ